MQFHLNQEWHITQQLSSWNRFWYWTLPTAAPLCPAVCLCFIMFLNRCVQRGWRCISKYIFLSLYFSLNAKFSVGRFQSIRSFLGQFLQHSLRSACAVKFPMWFRTGTKSIRCYSKASSAQIDQTIPVASMWKQHMGPPSSFSRTSYLVFQLLFRFYTLYESLRTEGIIKQRSSLWIVIYKCTNKMGFDLSRFYCVVLCFQKEQYRHILFF